MTSHHVVFVRYSGGKLKEMEDDALATLIRNSTHQDYSIRVIDNWTRREPLTALWNRTMRESDAPVVTYLNSDCWVGPGWDVAILAAFATDDHVTIACAAPHANMGEQTVPSTAGTPMGHDQDELARIARNCRVLWPCQVRDARIYGFCLSVRRSAWAVLGGFDESIPLYGADDEFCQRARDAGWRTVCVMDAYCWHQGEASSRVAQAAGRINLEEEREKGRRLFAAKERPSTQ